MKQLIKTINVDDGFEFRVVKIESGYSVVLYDSDADEFFPGTRIYNNLKDAIKYAEKNI